MKNFVYRKPILLPWRYIVGLRVWLSSLHILFGGQSVKFEHGPSQTACVPEAHSISNVDLSNGVVYYVQAVHVSPLADLMQKLRYALAVDWQINCLRTLP